MKMFLILAFVFCVFAFDYSYGQDASPSATPVAVASPASSATPAPSKTLSTVSSAVEKIPSSLPAWILAVLAFASELAMRFWPTVKPKSLFIFVGQLLGVIGLGFTKISGLLDQIVQNLKDDPAPKA